jgi:hypothetical protein
MSEVKRLLFAVKIRTEEDIKAEEDQKIEEERRKQEEEDRRRLRELM